MVLASAEALASREDVAPGAQAVAQGAEPARVEGVYLWLPGLGVAAAPSCPDAADGAVAAVPMEGGEAVAHLVEATGWPMYLVPSHLAAKAVVGEVEVEAVLASALGAAEAEVAVRPANSPVA